MPLTLQTKEPNPMDEKKLKNTAKRIKDLIPLAKAAVYETSVEERRALRDHTDEKIVKLFYLTRALRSEDARNKFVEGRKKEEKHRNEMEMERRGKKTD